MMSLSRREALCSAGAFLAAGTAGACVSSPQASPFFGSRGLPIGIQLYTLGDGVRQDFAGVLQSVAEIGYSAVQLAGFHGAEPGQIRAALDRAGLKCPSAHIAAQVRPGEPSLADDTGRLAASLHQIGVVRAITPVFLIPDRIDGATREGETRAQALARVAAQLEPDDWRRNADFLNIKGEALRREGLALAYHNHNPEFAPYPDGETGFSLLAANTDPMLVSFELDVGWAVMAGQRVPDLLATYPRRIAHAHVKDVSADVGANFAFRQSSVEVGRGMIDWSTLLPRLYEAGVRQYTVEQDPPFARPRLEAAAISFAHLAAIRG